jgi:hypothetical protein
MFDVFLLISTLCGAMITPTISQIRSHHDSLSYIVIVKI